MKFSNLVKQWSAQGITLGTLGILTIAPALAQSANFGSITLGTDSPSGSASGNTGGTFGLANIAGRDQAGRVCSGFGAPDPDHLLVLQEDFPNLTISVDSGGNDTTLLIQGPDDNTIRCGEDTARGNPDAMVQGSNWAAGTYRIWVGSHNQGQSYSYSLTAE